MSGNDIGKGAGPVAPIAAGVAVLPNTAGNPLLMVFSIVAIVAGVVALSSFIASRLVLRATR